MNHEQYNELLASPKKDLDCVTCHNPHQRAEFSMKQDCFACHTTTKTTELGDKMRAMGVECIDCHMPKAVKSAVSFGAHTADVRSHLITINLDPAAEMFTTDGKLARGYLTVEFACLTCHKNRDKDWAIEKANSGHE